MTEQSETLLCRICLLEGDEDHPLFHPCRCSGTIKYVHQHCLKKWLEMSKKDIKCELCGERFHFKKIVSANSR